MEAGSPHATFLACILAGDLEGARTQARRIADERGIAFLYEGVVRTALAEVGRLWAEDRVTVAGEHLATATAQCAIAELYPRFPWPERRSGRVVVGCVDGEQHELGARMLADLLALDGWDDVFLGASTREELVNKAAELQPALVALSVSLQHHLPAVSSCIAALRERLPNAKIIVGGRATERLPNAAQVLGADAVPESAEQAVQVARDWH